MAECDIVRDLLPLYADGVCSPESRELVERHLSECAGCRAEYEAMRAETPESPAHGRESDALRSAGKALKRARIRAWIISAAVVLLAIALLAGAYAAYHWLTSADGSDKTALLRSAEDYFNVDFANISDPVSGGGFMAALAETPEGEYYLVIFDPDELFDGRWRANGGSAGSNGIAGGEELEFHYADYRGAVLALAVIDPPEGAHYVSFWHEDTMYVTAIESAPMLKLFVWPDSWDTGHMVSYLDEGLHEVD